MAVLVNDTNFTTATWQAYQSNIVAEIGTVDGESTVWVGLRGHSWQSAQTWHGVTITRDTVPPQLFITQPVTNLTVQPVLQLHGYANEPLAAVRYDLTNATGLQSNLVGYITRQHLDTNTLRYTTNWFQGYDLGLETNLNALTVRVVDLAGNETSTNLSLTLDYSGDTNAPTITVTWPAENTLVAGESFTLRGQLDDPTASVVVELGVNSYDGTIERDGYFTIVAVPLETATNTLSIIATDAAGNTRTNTHTVRQSIETLTIDPLTPSQLAGPTVTVSGTVGISGQNVWVNGIAASVSGNTWTANVPTPSDNVANFEAQTGTSLENPAATQAVSVENPVLVIPVSYRENYYATWERTGISWSGTDTLILVRTQYWVAGFGGGSHQASYKSFSFTCEAEIVWPDSWPDEQVFPGDSYCLGPNEYFETTIIPLQKAGLRYSLSYVGRDGVDAWWIRQTAERTAETRLQIRVGGDAKMDQAKLIRLTVAAATFSTPERNLATASDDARYEINKFEEVGDVPIPIANLRVFGKPLTPTATNANVGELLLTLPAGTTNDLPIELNIFADDYTLSVGAEELKVDITQVISDQIPTNHCNQLPTQFFKGEPNNPMLMATRTGVSANLAILMDIATNLVSRVYVGVRKLGSQRVLGSAQAQLPPETTYLQFNAIDGREVYEVVAGYDFNENGALDDPEVIKIFEKTPRTDVNGQPANAGLKYLDKIIIVTQNKFNSAKNTIIGYNVIFTDYAGDLIEAFGLGATNLTDAVTTNGLPIQSTSFGLSHPVGAKWNTSCGDTTHRFTFLDGSEASNDFEDANALAQIVDATISNNLSALFATNSNDWLTSSVMAFSISKDLIVTEDVTIGINELGLAFGKVTIIGQLSVRYRKTSNSTIEVSSFITQGGFDDLYDFDYAGGERAREAVTVQAGNATLSTPAQPSGKVFYTRLEFQTGWKTLNKDYSQP